MEHFKQAMHKNDRDTAERLAHTLKGTSGNIGAFAIQQAAKDLQDAFKQDATKKVINQLYKKVEQELVPIIQALGKIELSGAADSQLKTGPLDLTKLIPLLDELKNLLADDDTGATEKIDQVSMELENSLFVDDVMTIAKHVNHYEFRNALDHLNILTEKIRAAH